MTQPTTRTELIAFDRAAMVKGLWGVAKRDQPGPREAALTFLALDPARVETLRGELGMPMEENDAFVTPLGSCMHEPKKRQATWDPSTVTALPPCLRAVAEDLAQGKNAGHMARFNLAAFLLKRDTSPDDVHSFFVNAPNYNEKMTRRQIDSIRAGGYAPNGCKKLRVLGLCRIDEVCRERSCESPLNYPRSAA